MVMEESSQPWSMSKEPLLGLGVSLVVLSAFFVAIRLAINVKKTKTFLAEDVVSVLALVLLTVSYALNCQVVNASASPTQPAQIPLLLAFHILVSLAMWSSKVPILLLYVRVFGKPNPWLRLTCHLTIFCTLLLFLSSVILVGIACTPPHTQNTAPIPVSSSGSESGSATATATSPPPEFISTCTTAGNTTGFILGFLAIATDVIILAIPVPVLAGMGTMPYLKKAGVFAVFMAGVLALVAGITAAYYKWLAISQPNEGSMRVAMLCRVVECCIAIIVGCVPMAYAFWKTYFLGRGHLDRLWGLVRSQKSGGS